MPATNPISAAPAAGESPVRTRCGDWTLLEYSVIGSTNLAAANLEPWTAVRADRQTGGRGRFQRTWVSDPGGLWLSAVVPLKDDILSHRALPLAAGVALCDALARLGVPGLRLRWPNDVMLRERKLAGLLIDRFKQGAAVVGIGLNVNNHPEARDAALVGHVARLGEVLPRSPALSAIAALVLSCLRSVLLAAENSGVSCVFDRCNQLWGSPRSVELDLDCELRRGIFVGLDPEGRLILSDPCGYNSFFDAHEVRHLTET